MLSAGEFIFELGHLLLGIVQHGAQFVRDPQIGRAAVDFRATLQLRAKPFLQLINICPNLLEQRASDSIALVQKSGKKMFVRDFGVVQLRREVLRRLQRLLHFLRVSVDAHGSKYQTGFARQLRFGKSTAANSPLGIDVRPLQTEAFDTNASTTMSVLR